MQRDLCGDETLCEAMDPIDGELLKNYLLKVNFTGLLPTFFNFHILMRKIYHCDYFNVSVHSSIIVFGEQQNILFQVNKGKDTSREGIQ